MPDFNATFKPISWPQDKLRVPSGHGLMPSLDLQNKVLVKRELFCISATIGPIGYGQSRTTTIDVGDDGDFWCSSFAARVFLPTTSVFDDEVWSSLSIQDVRSGYNLCEPAFRTEFIKLNRAGDPVTLIQPYCFTRTGAIQVNWSIDAKAVAARNHTLYLTFYGWKEYADASK